MSKSTRAGLVFPVARVQRQIKKGGHSKRTALDAAIYLTAIAEYLTSEILEISYEVTKANKKQTISPRHIMMAVRNDEETNALFGSDSIIAHGGVTPKLDSRLLRQKKKRVAKE